MHLESLNRVGGSQDPRVPLVRNSDESEFGRKTSHEPFEQGNGQIGLSSLEISHHESSEEGENTNRFSTHKCSENNPSNSELCQYLADLSQLSVEEGQRILKDEVPYKNFSPTSLCFMGSKDAKIAQMILKDSALIERMRVKQNENAAFENLANLNLLVLKEVEEDIYKQEGKTTNVAFSLLDERCRSKLTTSVLYKKYARDEYAFIVALGRMHPEAALTILENKEIKLSASHLEQIAKSHLSPTQAPKWWTLPLFGRLDVPSEDQRRAIGEAIKGVKGEIQGVKNRIAISPDQSSQLVDTTFELLEKEINTISEAIDAVEKRQQDRLKCIAQKFPAEQEMQKRMEHALRQLQAASLLEDTLLSALEGLARQLDGCLGVPSKDQRRAIGEAIKGVKGKIQGVKNWIAISTDQSSQLVDTTFKPLEEVLQNILTAIAEKQQEVINSVSLAQKLHLVAQQFPAEQGVQRRMEDALWQLQAASLLGDTLLSALEGLARQLDGCLGVPSKDQCRAIGEAIKGVKDKIQGVKNRIAISTDQSSQLVDTTFKPLEEVLQNILQNILTTIAEKQQEVINSVSLAQKLHLVAQKFPAEQGVQRRMEDALRQLQAASLLGDTLLSALEGLAQQLDGRLDILNRHRRRAIGEAIKGVKGKIQGVKNRIAISTDQSSELVDTTFELLEKEINTISEAIDAVEKKQQDRLNHIVQQFPQQEMQKGMEKALRQLGGTLFVNNSILPAIEKLAQQLNGHLAFEEENKRRSVKSAIQKVNQEIQGLKSQVGSSLKGSLDLVDATFKPLEEEISTISNAVEAVEQEQRKAKKESRLENITENFPAEQKANIKNALRQLTEALENKRKEIGQQTLIDLDTELLLSKIGVLGQQLGKHGGKDQRRKVKEAIEEVKSKIKDLESLAKGRNNDPLSRSIQTLCDQLKAAIETISKAVKKKQPNIFSSFVSRK